MAPKSGGRIHTPTKPLEDSSMTYDEEQDLYSQMSKLEQEIKGLVKMVDLTNLNEYLEKMFMQVLDERLPESDNVA